MVIPATRVIRIHIHMRIAISGESFTVGTSAPSQITLIHPIVFLPRVRILKKLIDVIESNVDSLSHNEWKISTRRTTPIYLVSDLI